MIGCIASPSSSVVQSLLKRANGPRSSFNLSGLSFQKVFTGGGPWSLFVASAKKKDKPDTHIPRPDEATGPYPEAVLLRKKVVKQDGRVEPEFADAEEEKLYNFLKLQLESDLTVERMRHYEVVYLIHEDHADEVDVVLSKVQDYIKEKKGRIWRLNNWGLRRLCYKIKRASNANYILMNFEIEAKWINDFKSMLDKDERIIRHLVMKRSKAITEDCPPPPEYHTIRKNQGMEDDFDDDDDDDEDDDDDDKGYDDDYDYNFDFDVENKDREEE
ncbi:hypothetical protein HPP92_027992 [Vanilla planifolia]|uniref:Ribosomal protein S6 n=1 Tax=Vanilla planifolia TaxID=51239 RepID=A0A835P9Q7_VANPL|nr:hypothetical protein HPP92_027992 [Vanilla planifolia]